MPASLSTLVAKDGAGTTIPGGVQFLDVSGTGAGPWTQSQIILDGIGGVTRATVKAASTAPLATDTAIVVAVSPNGQNANGQATSANSSPVVGASDWIQLVGGDVSHDAADSGKPEKIGGRAIAGLSTATLVAAADRTDALFGIDGAQITRPHCGLEDITSGVAAITDGSSTSVIASQGAGVKTYLTSVMISNTSAVAVTVDLRDGAAGTVKATLPVPANTSGLVTNFPVPLPFSAATAVCADPSAAASTITVTLLGFKSKV